MRDTPRTPRWLRIIMTGVVGVEEQHEKRLENVP